MQGAFEIRACPIPADRLTQTLPNYANLFSVGTDLPNCRWNAIYTARNYPGMYFTQDALLKERVPGLPVPIFSWEKADNGRTYTLCSYSAMMERLRNASEKHYYSMLPPDVPLHFYCDFDLSADDIAPEMLGERSVHGAMTEFFACLDAVIARLRAREPSWSGFNGHYTSSLLYGNKTGKQSAHLVIHMSDSHMLANVRACYSFYALLVMESLLRHPQTAHNPMFFLPKDSSDFKCIFDQTVYSPYRNFRTVASFKNKEDRTKIAGGMYPRCPAWSNDAPGTGCSDADCFYHVHGRFLDTDFLANDPTFIPRLTSGAPVLPQLLQVPLTDNPLLKRNKKRLANSHSEAPGALLAAFSLFSTNSNGSRSGSGSETNGSIVVTPLSRTASLGSPLAQPVTLGSEAQMRNRCFALIARIVAEATGYLCAVVAGAPTDDVDSVLISSNGHDCPYGYRTKNAGADPDMLIAYHCHRRNHVCYLATIDLPLPRVSCRCSDKDCRDFLEKHKNYVSLDVDNTSAALRADYVAAARAYMLSVDVSMFSLYN